eukprot:428636_1
MEVSYITRLVNAVENEDLAEIRKVVLLCETDVNTPDENGDLALSVAAKNGNREAVQIILENPNVDVNGANISDGWTPLISAVMEGHANIAKLLLENPNVDVNKVNNRGSTPLYSGTNNGHVELVQLLLENPKVDVNKASANGWTPLNVA